MSDQPEALRLAAELEAARDDPMWADHAEITKEACARSAAELRRLHQFAEDQIGRATAAEAALQMTKATHALKIAAVEAQRDALLEALKWLDKWMSDKTIPECVWKVRAAIKAVEGEKE